MASPGELSSNWHIHKLQFTPSCTHTRIHNRALTLSLSLTLSQAGVALASAGELSFNWTGFISAMLSNLTFGFRAVWSKM